MRTKNRRNRWGVGVLLALWVQVAQASGQYTITVQPGEFTIEQALQQARLNRLQGGLDRPVLQLQPGTYRLSQPVVLRPEDSQPPLWLRVAR